VKALLNYAAAAVLGATAMYLLDPRLGRRRRALLRDKVVAGRHDVDRYARKTGKRAADHLRGMAAEARAGAGLGAHPPGDRQLEERVRAALGRAVSNPGAVDVGAADGQVCLSGKILASEHERLIAEVSSVAGVESVEDRLEVYERPGFVPELQGATRS